MLPASSIGGMTGLTSVPLTGWALCGHDTPAGAPRGEVASDCDCEEEGCSGFMGDSENTEGGAAGGASAATVGEAAASGGSHLQSQGPGGAPCDSIRSTPNDLGSPPSLESEIDATRVNALSNAAAGGLEAASAVAELLDGQSAPFDPVLQLPRAMRMVIGQKCKQLIDVGRLDWLRLWFGSAELVHYIGSEVTGENRLLLAVHPEFGRNGGGGVNVDSVLHHDVN